MKRDSYAAVTVNSISSPLEPPYLISKGLYVKTNIRNERATVFTPRNMILLFLSHRMHPKDTSVRHE